MFIEVDAMIDISETISKAGKQVFKLCEEARDVLISLNNLDQTGVLTEQLRNIIDRLYFDVTIVNTLARALEITTSMICDCERINCTRADDCRVEVRRADTISIMPEELSSVIERII